VLQLCHLCRNLAVAKSSTMKSVFSNYRSLALRIGKLLDSGSSKQEVYKALAPEYANTGNLARIVANTPTQQDFDRSQTIGRVMLAVITAFYGVCAYLHVNNIMFAGISGRPRTIAIVQLILITCAYGFDLYLFLQRRKRVALFHGFIFTVIFANGSTMRLAQGEWAYVVLALVLAILACFIWYHAKLRVGVFRTMRKDAQGAYIF
jgi:hypothetical protein